MCIDPVVLPVRSDEPDIDNATRIIDPHDDAILVADDIEYSAAVVENARAADGSLHVRRRRPVIVPPWDQESFCGLVVRFNQFERIP